MSSSPYFGVFLLLFCYKLSGGFVRVASQLCVCVFVVLSL